MSRKPRKAKPAPKAKKPTPADPRRADLIARVASYCAAEYGGDFGVLFRATDRNGDGWVTPSELTGLFTAAGVGTRLTRFVYVRAVIAELDTDGDGYVALSEFEAVLNPGMTTTQETTNVFDDLIKDVRALTDAWKNAEWTDALRSSAALQIKLADLIDAMTGGGVMAAGPVPVELTAAFAEMEACMRAPLPVMAAGDPVGFNPAILLPIIQAVFAAWKWWRERSP